MNETTNEMKALARKVYQENKAVIDFIVEHNSSTEFQFAVSQLVFPDDTDKDPDAYDEFKIGEETFVYFAKNKKLFSFLPKAWIDVIGEVKKEGRKTIFPENHLWQGCETWWWSYPLICWIQLEQKTKNDKETYSLKLYAEVGPYDSRQNLIETIDNYGGSFVLFNKGGKKYSKFLKYNNGNKVKFILSVEDPQDFEEITGKMIKLLDSFSTHVVNDVKGALIHFMKSLPDNTEAGH